jgi:type I restriction enzyme S subunit
MVPLGEVAEPVVRAIAPEPGTTYRFVGVKWWGEGAYEFARKLGSETAAPTLYRVKRDDIVINKIWARHGSVAVVPPELDGAVGSAEFPTFMASARRLSPRWMHWWSKTKTAWDACASSSFGSSGKNRIKPTEFLRISIPLPPLDVQRRILEQLDAVEARLSTMSALRKERDADSEQLLRTLMSADPATTPVPMSDLVRLREPDVMVDRSASYDFAGVYSFGRGVFRAGTKTGMDFAYPRLSTVRTGDFTYPKLMAWEGALGVVPPECNGCVVSTEFPVFQVLQDRVLPEVLDVHFRNPSIWPQLAGASTGTNARRRRLNPSDFLAYQFPLPSRSVQAQVAKAYRLSQEIRQRDQVIDAETRAILPALLAEAFGGG